MKIITLIIILIFINKISSAYDLFETTLYEIDFISENIEDDKIKINGLPGASKSYISFSNWHKGHDVIYSNNYFHI